jgi:hypothetical protein
LVGHEQFPIAQGLNSTVRDPMDGLDMLVSDLAAADERDPEGA